MPNIIIKQGTRRYHLTWELLSKDKRNEKYKLYPPKAPEKFIILINNTPLVKQYAKRREGTWKQIEGKPVSPGMLQAIIEQIINPDIEKGLPAKVVKETRKQKWSETPLKDRNKNKN